MADRDVNIQLTSEQFAFLNARHEEVEHAAIAVKLGDISAIDALISSPDYQRMFGKMTWDEAYDRYQDTPGYDSSLTQALHQQLQADLRAGKVELRGAKAVLTDDELSVMGLRRLDE